MKSKQPSKKKSMNMSRCPATNRSPISYVCWEDGPVRINFTRGKLHWESFIYLLSV